MLLPYNLLLQKNAREALGIDLTNQVIIIDEAHSKYHPFIYWTQVISNTRSIDLISTLLSLSTITLNFRTLSTSLNQLNVYITKFRKRLSTEHLLHLKRLVGLLEALVKHAEEWKAKQNSEGTLGLNAGSKTKNPTVEVMTSGELLRRLGRNVEGVNVLEVEQYLHRSKVPSFLISFLLLSALTLHPIDRSLARSLDTVPKRWRKRLVKVGTAFEHATVTCDARLDLKKLAKLARMAATTPPLHIVENFIVSLIEANDGA